MLLSESETVVFIFEIILGIIACVLLILTSNFCCGQKKKPPMRSFDDMETLETAGDSMAQSTAVTNSKNLQYIFLE